MRGLADGSLPRESFQFYAVQDALYLRDFARALSLAAARAPEDEWIIMFNEHAAGALKVERALHESFFREWGLTPAAVAGTPMAPTTLAYTSYLLAVAYGSPFHEAMAALLPCYWIYWEVGKDLERTGSPDAVYARWIRTYASGEFGDVVRGVLDATDRVAERLHAHERDAMRLRRPLSRRAATSGCSGTWRSAARAGRSYQPPPPRRPRHPRRHRKKANAAPPPSGRAPTPRWARRGSA